VTDEGPGFRLDDVPDPTADENLQRPCGRGLMLIRAYMDEVSFNETGNEITMVKRKG
jgi:serine/threonine-protein kinase RsbW